MKRKAEDKKSPRFASRCVSSIIIARPRCREITGADVAPDNEKISVPRLYAFRSPPFSFSRRRQNHRPYREDIHYYVHRKKRVLMSSNSNSNSNTHFHSSTLYSTLFALTLDVRSSPPKWASAKIYEKRIAFLTFASIIQSRHRDHRCTRLERIHEPIRMTWSLICTVMIRIVSRMISLNYRMTLISLYSWKWSNTRL